MDEHASAVVRAVAFPSTDRGLHRLRIASSTYLHVNFLVVADRERFALVGRRSNAFAVIPVETVQSIRVGETESGFWNREVTLAIFLVVDGPKGITELLIVPAGDDFGGRLTWHDSTVRALAARLSEASGVPFTGAPKRGRNSLPDWTLDV